MTPRVPGPRPACPLGHEGSISIHGRRVRRDGKFARLRFRCVPFDGSAAHTFTPGLRVHAGHEVGVSECPACQHQADLVSGAAIRSGSTFALLDAAELLVQVGAGGSLRLTSQRRRADSGLRMDPFDETSREATLAADYLDVVGPAVVPALRPATWLAYVALDSLPLEMLVRAAEAAALQLPTGTRGGAVLAATGAVSPDRKMRAWSARFGGTQNQVAWMDFLRSLPGQPEWVVADRAGAITAAVTAVWPDAVLYPCEHHLRGNIMKAARADGVAGAHLPKREPLAEVVAKCLFDPEAWDELVRQARRLGAPTLGAWLRANRVLVRRDMFAMREAFPNAPRGNGSVEAVCSHLKAALGTRTANFRNAERLDMVIELMAANSAGRANMTSYVRLLKERFGADGSMLPSGRSWDSQHDRAGQPSSVAQAIAVSLMAQPPTPPPSNAHNNANTFRRHAKGVKVARGAKPIVITAGASGVGSIQVRGRRLTDFPRLVAEWDPDNELAPRQVKAGSALDAKWICATCGHHWIAKVGQRASRASGCPKCRGVRVPANKSLAALFPTIAAEWDPQANGKRTPSDITPASEVSATWRCLDFPGVHAPYAMRVRTRTSREIGCPVCRRLERDANR